MGLKKVDCQLTISKGGREGGHKNIKEPKGGNWVDPPSPPTRGDRK